MRFAVILLLAGCARETGLAPLVDRDAQPEQRPDLDLDGFSVFDGDCDDTNPKIHPDADEVCGNLVDDNCDGSANGCRLTGTIGSTEGSHAQFFGDRLAGLGGAMLALGDATGDGVTDLLVSDPYRGVAERDQSGAAHLFHGPFAGTKAYSQAEGHWNGALPDRIVGKTVRMADLNGDGVQDVLVGHESYTTAWLCPCTGGYDLQVDKPYKSWDKPIFVVGDVDGDGVDEYQVDNTTLVNIGTDAVVARLPSGFSILRSQAFAAPSDLNGDGIADLLLQRGVRISETDPRTRVQIAILHGPMSGDIPFSAIRLTEPLPYGEGWGNPTVGDVDGDGDLDLSVSTKIYAGPDFAEAIAWVEPDEGGRCLSKAPIGEILCSIHLVGDLDGDGVEDAILEEQDPIVIEGRAAVVYGPLLGPIRPESASALLESDDRLPRLFPGPPLPPYLVFYDWLADGAERASGIVWVFRPGW